MADSPRRPLDLRKARPPAAPPPAQPPAPPAGWGPPPGFVKPGEVRQAEHLTPFEKAQYAKLGVEPGTPVPGNLADIIQSIKEEAAAVGPELPLPADFQVAPPTIVEEADLTPEQRARVRQVVEEVATQARQAAAIPQLPNAPPGVNEAILAAEMTRPRESDPAPGTAPGALHVMPATAPRLSAGVLPPGGVYRHAGRVEELPEDALERLRAAAAPQRAADAPAAPPPAADAPTAETGATAPGTCPHCGWDQSRTSGIEPTATDRYTFLWSILGGPEQRFTRQHELMGGKVTLNFRTLTSDEADQALLQVAHDYRAGRLAGDINWWQRWMDYRLAMGLESVTIDGVGKPYVGPASLADVEFDPPVDEDGVPLPGTAYPALWEHLQSRHLYNESFRKAVSLAFASFADLVRKLEANIDNADFPWGIGAPA